MIAPLAAVLLALLAAQEPLPPDPVELTFIAAIAAGDGPAAQALLTGDATIMHDQGGGAQPSTAAAVAAFLRGCQGEVLFDVNGDEPGAMAYTVGWTCGERGQTQMLLWTQSGQIVWVQLFALEVQPAEAPEGDR